MTGKPDPDAEKEHDMRITGSWTREARLMAALGSAAMTAAAACSGAHAQSAAFIEQIGDRNETSITQRGENNSAAVTIKGSDNGTGVVSSQTRSLVAYNRQALFGFTLPITSPRSGPSGGTLTTPELESGVVNQNGKGNAARLNIFGDQNQYHVTQNGNYNAAVQGVRGADNQVGIVQNGVGSGNLAVQAQAGNTNSAITLQNGGNNVAVQLQGGFGAGVVGTAIKFGAMSPTALAANLGAANSAEVSLSAMSGGSGNVSLLEQNGDNNSALLVQAGNNNSIALRQPGDSYAAVTQLGNNHSIGIDQRAGTMGTSPISITQY